MMPRQRGVEALDYQVQYGGLSVRGESTYRNPHNMQPIASIDVLPYGRSEDDR